MPTSTMMKAKTSSSVEASRGARASKRMIPSRAASAPTITTTPSTSSALANSEPTIALWATSCSPACSAKMTTNSSGRLPTVAWSSPVAAEPSRSPTSPVASDTTQAMPASAAVATANAATALQWS